MTSRDHASVTAIATIAVLMASSQANKNTLKYENFAAKIDNFDAKNLETFNLRYAKDEEHWNANGGPIFIHTANEGSIEEHVNETGALFDWAREFKALLIFVEHRYYGKSMPFGDASMSSTQKTAFLTTEQTLADYARLIMWLKKQPGAKTSKVTTFGCGIAGLLAIWLKTRYQYLVDAVVAGSPPLRMVMLHPPCDLYFQHVTKAYDASSTGCSDQVRKIWPILTKMGSTDNGRQKLKDKFKLCQDLPANNFQDFKDWVRNSYVGLAAMNYPHAFGDIPANPVKAACQMLANKNEDGMIEAVATAVAYFRNRTGATSCFSPESDDRVLEYQMCKEFVHPICGDGKNDMFYPMEWRFGEFSQKCRQKFSVQPPKNKIFEKMAGDNLCGVIFTVISCGNMDPWAPYCVDNSFKPYTQVYRMKNTARCLDLHSPHPNSDPQDVKNARQSAKDKLREWLEYQKYIFPLA